MQKKRDQLLETAQRLFKKFGINRISIEEVCHEAHISKGTFYKYFSNKRELANTIKNQLLKVGFSAFDEISKQKIPFMEKVNQMTQWQMKFFEQMSPEFIQDVASGEEIELEFKKRYLANLEQAQKTGEVRSDLNLELIYQVTKKISEIAADSSWKTMFADYGTYVQQVRTIFFFGLLSRPEVPLHSFSK